MSKSKSQPILKSLSCCLDMFVSISRGSSHSSSDEWNEVAPRFTCSRTSF